MTAIPPTPAPPTPASWTFRPLTPTLAPGGVAIIRLEGDLAAFFDAAAMAPIATEARGVRLLANLDRGLVCRWTADLLDLMPHGGVLVVRTILEWLEALGGRPGTLSAQGRWPEASGTLEARLLEAQMLDALATAASPAAVPLLLRQPQLWASGQPSAPERDRILNHLLHPPLVVALGPSNVGKSSLLNALAGRTVAIEADEPGTTRDHVGVLLEVGGLVIRYCDTPGIRAEASDDERAAVDLALQVARQADLILNCGDHIHPPIAADALEHILDRPHPGTPTHAAATLTLRTRSDLYPPANPPATHRAGPTQLCVSTKNKDSITAVASLIREALVPTDLERAPTPWKFWDDAPSAAPVP